MPSPVGVTWGVRGIRASYAWLPLQGEASDQSDLGRTLVHHGSPREEELEEVHVWLHLEESLADGDEASDVQHPHRIEVLQFQTPLVEEPAQKPVHGVSQSALVEGKERNHLIGMRLRELLLPGDPLVHHLLRR